jgi:hypothetical protein
MDGLPFNHSQVGAVGAGTGVAIPVSGIKSGATLLAVVRFNASTVLGLDPAAFSVSNGSIQSATLNTAGFSLAVLWA